MKKTVSLLLTAALLCSLFSGCDRQTVPEEEDGPVTLTVVSEYSVDPTVGGDTGPYNVYSNLMKIISEYQRAHKDVTVDLNMLPVKGKERQIALQKLRTQIMSGGGPDLFLLPAGKVGDGLDTSTFTYSVEDPLFPDVAQAMRNCLFYDLSELYDSDEELKQEELKQEVMDAGKYEGRRYVLPLGWDMPVAVYTPTAMRSAGLSESMFDGTVYDVFDAALDSENSDIMREISFLPRHSVCFFPNLFDYETDSVTLTKEDVKKYFEYHARLDREGKFSFDVMEYSRDVTEYLYAKKDYLEIMPCVLADLHEAPDYLGMAKLEGREAEAVPLRSGDGTVVAEITYWGAVNANSAHPRAAYDFLREFLSPGIQHQKDYGAASVNFSLQDCAWPVRVTGSVEEKWRVTVNRALSSSVSGLDENYRCSEETTEARREALSASLLTDGDMPLLFRPLDEVRFATGFSHDLYYRIDFSPYPKTDDEIDKLSSRLMQLAEYHMGES